MERNFAEARRLLVETASGDRLLIKNSIRNVAAFLFQSDHKADDVKISSPSGELFLSKFGPYIDKCTDTKYFMSIRKELLQMQRGYNDQTFVVLADEQQTIIPAPRSRR